MKLYDDWRYIARKAWSTRLMALAGVLTGCEAVLPLVTDELPWKRSVIAAVTFFIVMGAFIARLLVQNDERIDGK